MEPPKLKLSLNLKLSKKSLFDHCCYSSCCNPVYTLHQPVREMKRGQDLKLLTWVCQKNFA